MAVPEEQMAQMMGPEQAPVVTQPELVGGVSPDQLPPEVTVADDVPRDVPENSFVLSGAAVEEAGLADVVDMLTNAIKRARELGIDIGEEYNNTSDEDLVKLLVSRGEVLIPEPYVRVIGLDKLKKMNARGERETSRRLEETQQQEQAPQQGAPLPQEQIIAQEASQEPSGVQMMATGGEAEDNRAGFVSAIMSPVDTYQGMQAIETFAKEATERYRQVKGTKAFAVDNILDAFRHFTGSMLLYRDYSDSLAGTALTANEILGAPGDYIAGAIDPNAASGSASREMDYHNNEVAKLHASKISTAKFAQMSNRAVEEYARKYFDEIEAMYADGSIVSVDPRLIPMFSPAGNEGYTPMTPEVDTKSLYIKGPDNNWMDNPNHPDVKARMERQGKSVGGQAQRTSSSESLDDRDRTKEDYNLEIPPDLSSFKTPEQAPAFNMRQERQRPEQGGYIFNAKTYQEFTDTLMKKFRSGEINEVEVIENLGAARAYISDEQFDLFQQGTFRGAPEDTDLSNTRPFVDDYNMEHYYSNEDKDDRSRVNNLNTGRMLNIT